ncbi:hypothetical protein [Pseudomonas asiatica]|uniref:hypothetical protein n=1 Tax=Pseudomonas asiatica TaxID=2219225 RepID=UPI0025AA99F8|nr:hypothetical protein [Pseudomonas asiatica]MDM9591197.1 hypothetical protein [Pseudomonas asiatica]
MLLKGFFLLPLKLDEDISFLDNLDGCGLSGLLIHSVQIPILRAKLEMLLSLVPSAWCSALQKWILGFLVWQLGWRSLRTNNLPLGNPEKDFLIWQNPRTPIAELFDDETNDLRRCRVRR